MAAPDVDLRLDGVVWRDLARHLASDDEQVGALLVRGKPAHDPATLVAERWRPVTQEYVRDRTHGLTWDGRFNLRLAEEAEASGLGVVFVHRHAGELAPRLSRTDRSRGQALLRFLRRRCPEGIHGVLVLANAGIAGWVESPNGRRRWAEVRSAGPPLVVLPHRTNRALIDPADRQLLAFGVAGMHALATTRIGLVGVSGGGGHVGQQLIHAGVGTLVAVDAQTVEDTNLRRLVAARRRDVDRTLKVQVARRLARDVRSGTRVVTVAEEFPSARSLGLLRRVDILIGCVDGWDVRDDLNSFALQHRIPYIDIGAVITPPTGSLGVRASGQIAIVAPGGPCLRCMGIVTDDRVEEARQRRQGYLGAAANEPQVVSINGSLASEAVTAALMLAGGAASYSARRRYLYPPGLLREVNARPVRECPACREAGLRGSRSMRR
jgi:molybdopterin/thiamine biosynthesis adenylyltransferase